MLSPSAPSSARRDGVLACVEAGTRAVSRRAVDPEPSTSRVGGSKDAAFVLVAQAADANNAPDGTVPALSAA